MHVVMPRGQIGLYLPLAAAVGFFNTKHAQMYVRRWLSLARWLCMSLSFVCPFVCLVSCSSLPCPICPLPNCPAPTCIGCPWPCQTESRADGPYRRAYVDAAIHSARQTASQRKAGGGGDFLAHVRPAFRPGPDMLLSCWAAVLLPMYSTMLLRCSGPANEITGDGLFLVGSIGGCIGRHVVCLSL